MKKLIITSIVSITILSACNKSMDGNKKEDQTQTVYFRLNYESKTENVIAKNVVIAKFK